MKLKAEICYLQQFRFIIKIIYNIIQCYKIQAMAKTCAQGGGGVGWVEPSLED